MTTGVSLRAAVMHLLEKRGIKGGFAAAMSECRFVQSGK
jgi:hypothetical protein